MRLFRNKRLAGPIQLSAAGLVVVGLGTFATQIHDTTTDCKLDENGHISALGACVADAAAAFAGLLGAVFGAAVFCGAIVLPAARDLETIHSDNNLILLDGVIANSSDFNHDWVLDKLQNEGERHYVLVNTTRPGVKLAHELWREGDHKMVTTHAQYEPTDSLERRTTTDWYFHGAGDYLRYPAKVPATLGQDVFNFFYHHNVADACLWGTALTSTGSKYRDLWAGLSISKSSTNNAPLCKTPGGTYWEIWHA